MTRSSGSTEDGFPRVSIFDIRTHDLLEQSTATIRRELRENMEALIASQLITNGLSPSDFVMEVGPMTLVRDEKGEDPNKIIFHAEQDVRIRRRKPHEYSRD